MSLEGYVDATILLAALQQSGPQVDTEKLVATLESLRDLDIGLDADGRYQPIDLQ